MASRIRTRPGRRGRRSCAARRSSSGSRSWPSPRSRRLSDALRVTAPASSANLGPGFDSMALALDLRNEVVIEPADGVPPQVEVTGEGAEEAPAGRDNLFLRAFVAAGGDPAGLRFRMRNRVPFAR